MTALTLNVRYTIPRQLPVTAAEVDAVRRAAPGILGLLLERRALLDKARQEELVNLLVQDVPMRPVNLRLARLQAKALEQVYSGCEWLTAEQIGTLGGHGRANPAAAAQRWKERGQIFALRRQGRDMYPRYALGDDFAPLPAMRAILAVWGDVSPARIAAWFESVSSFLGGQRPREALATQPERVLAAAHDAVAAERAVA